MRPSPAQPLTIPHAMPRLQHLGHRFGELSARDTNELGSSWRGSEGPRKLNRVR